LTVLLGAIWGGMKVIWGWARAVWKWLLDNPIALAASIGGVVGAYLMWKSQTNKIARLEDAAEVQAHRARIAAAETRAEMLVGQAEVMEPEVNRLKAEIAKSKRRVVELHDGVDITEMSDEDIARRFADSGL